MTYVIIKRSLVNDYPKITRTLEHCLTIRYFVFNLDHTAFLMLENIDENTAATFGNTFS